MKKIDECESPSTEAAGHDVANLSLDSEDTEQCQEQPDPAMTDLDPETCNAAGPGVV